MCAKSWRVHPFETFGFPLTTCCVSIGISEEKNMVIISKFILLMISTK